MRNKLAEMTKTSRSGWF